MPEVSVIVAVYNSEKYLGRCIESIRKQSFEDWECLLIDDGSTDASGVMCDTYASSDFRFKAFHKENGGVGSARKLGLEKATGNYIIHIDSDDWVESDMLQELFSAALSSEADVVICDFYRDTDQRCIKSVQKPSGQNASSSLKDMYTGFGGPVNKFVRKDCILKFGVSFPEDSRFAEDLYFFINLFSNPVSVSYLPKAFYHYKTDANPLSTNNNSSFEGYMRQVHGILKLVDITSEENYPLLANGRYFAHCAYKALKLKFHTRSEYREIYALLSDAEIIHNRDISLHERLILWCSFHFSYSLAILGAQIVQKHLNHKK